MPTRRHLIALGAASVVAPGLIRSALASGWPDRTVHIVVPLAAGGPTDVNARVVAEQLAKIWGQQVVIDNKAGAGCADHRRVRCPWLCGCVVARHLCASQNAQ